MVTPRPLGEKQWVTLVPKYRPRGCHLGKPWRVGLLGGAQSSSVCASPCSASPLFLNNFVHILSVPASLECLLLFVSLIYVPISSLPSLSFFVAFTIPPCFSQTPLHFCHKPPVFSLPAMGGGMGALAWESGVWGQVRGFAGSLATAAGPWLARFSVA